MRRYDVRGPDELPRAAAHFFECRGPVEGVLGGALYFVLCGRVLSHARVEALATGLVDETAALVAAANAGRPPPVFESE